MEIPMIDHELEYRFNALMEVALEADEAIEDLFEQVLEEASTGTSRTGVSGGVQAAPRPCGS
jgi:hypothetical protein